MACDPQCGLRYHCVDDTSQQPVILYITFYLLCLLTFSFGMLFCACWLTKFHMVELCCGPVKMYEMPVHVFAAYQNSRKNHSIKEVKTARVESSI